MIRWSQQGQVRTPIGTALARTHLSREFLLERSTCGLTSEPTNELFLSKEVVLELRVMVFWSVRYILQVTVWSTLSTVASDSIPRTPLHLAASRCFPLYHIKLIKPYHSPELPIRVNFQGTWTQEHWHRDVTWVLCP